MVGIVFAILMILWISVYVAEPLQQSRKPIVVTESPLKSLLEEKEKVMASLRDVEFDFAAGKLSQSDYQSQKEFYLAQAVSITQKIEEVLGARKKASQKS